MRKFLLVLVVWCSALSTAECGTALPVALRLFAHTQVEMTDTRGRYLKVTPPILEYREISKWEPSEISLSPEKLDAIAIISTQSDFKSLSVNNLQFFT